MTERRWIGWTWRLAALLGIVAVTASPAAAAGDDIATLEAASGRLSVLRLGQPQALTPSMTLRLNDIIVTREGRATVRFNSDGTVLRVGPDSRVEINESAMQREVTVFFGRIWAHVMRLKERTTQFKTGSTIAAIRGTELSLGVAVDGDETQLSVLEGKVQAQTDAGSLDLGAGQVAVGKKGKAPALAVQVRPAGCREVGALLPAGRGRSSPRRPARARPRSVNRSRRPRRATSRAPSRASKASTPRTSRTRGSSTIGRRCSSARARRRKRARTSSRPSGWPPTTATPSPCRRSWRWRGTRPTRRSRPPSGRSRPARSRPRPRSPSPTPAKPSSTWRAPGRASRQAVTLEPDDALAWARLAEIRSSLGYRSEALEAAQKAVALSPEPLADPDGAGILLPDPGQDG